MRIDETSQHNTPESQILAIIYKKINKDPKEGLGIIALTASTNKINLDDIQTILDGSSYVLPFHSNVKINELIVCIKKDVEINFR